MSLRFKLPIKMETPIRFVSKTEPPLRGSLLGPQCTRSSGGVGSFRPHRRGRVTFQPRLQQFVWVRQIDVPHPGGCGERVSESNLFQGTEL